MSKISFFFVLFFFILTINIFSQENSEVEKEKKSKFNVGSEITSRYIWRGIQLSDGPCVQAFVEYQYKNFKIGSWSSYSVISTKGSEVDLYTSYTFLKNMFTVLISDYFFPNENGISKYFDFNKDNTLHILEGTLSFNGTKKLPLTLLYSCNFFGADAKKVNNDPTSLNFNSSEGIQYSMYFELGYLFNFDDTDIKIFSGYTPNNPKESNLSNYYIGENAYYARKPGFINCGISASKSLKINDNFSFPIKASFITNPIEEKVFFVFGFSF